MKFHHILGMYWIGATIQRMKKQYENKRGDSTLILLVNVCFEWVKSWFEPLSYQLKRVKAYDAYSHENENNSKATGSDKCIENEIENVNLYIPEDIYGVML